jgi:hypothetical protein
MGAMNESGCYLINRELDPFTASVEDIAVLCDKNKDAMKLKGIM